MAYPYDDSSGPSPFAGPTMPWYSQLMSDQAGLPEFMARTARRTERTLLSGGFTKNPATGKVARYIQSNWSPRSLLRYPNQNIFSPTEVGTSPFQAAEIMNGGAVKAYNRVARGVNNLPNRRIFNKIFGDRSLPTLNDLSPGIKVAPGFVGRMNAATSLARGAKFEQSSINSYLRGSIIGPTSGGYEKMFAQGSDVFRSQLIGASINGSITGPISGYVSASRGGGRLMEGAYRFAEETGNTHFLKGADLAAKHLQPLYDKLGAEAGTKLIGKEAVGGIAKLATEEGYGIAAKAGLAYGAESLAFGASMFTGVGEVLAVAGLVKTGVDIVGFGIKGGLAAYKDSQKALDRPIFGGVYNETAAGITSRQRGVMAIQNSQLNARSILGNEAAGMMAHFG